MLCEDYASDSDSDSAPDAPDAPGAAAPEAPAQQQQQEQQQQQQQRRESDPAPEDSAPPRKRACVDTPPKPRMVPPQVWKRQPNTTAVDF